MDSDSRIVFVTLLLCLLIVITASIQVFSSQNQNQLIIKQEIAVEKASPCNAGCTAKICSLSYGDSVVSRMFPDNSFGLITGVHGNQVTVSWCCSVEKKDISYGTYWGCEWKHELR